jgi:SAM-dependent methyltransferase
MGKKRKKDHPIPCDYLAPEKSDRPQILYRILHPHLVVGESYLDVTCGYAVLADHIIPAEKPSSYTGFDMNERVIDYCRERHPGATWLVSLSSEFGVESRYDVILHIGVSSIRYNVHEIHRRITKRPEGLPRLVFLEFGTTDTGDDHADDDHTGFTFTAINEIYAEHGFVSMDQGRFHAGDILYPVRCWTILTQQESGTR